ncbi:MAG: hypothetical protein JSV16_06650 [Candidatus Hydrogenedentota bacterium]|nr:MAG: hypothetical protein JSV16_06650 [Candidatus Hydrogenedentota bacterium]
MAGFLESACRCSLVLYAHSIPLLCYNLPLAYSSYFGKQPDSKTWEDSLSNIMILNADALACDALVCHESASIRKPNIDSIAREGAGLKPSARTTENAVGSEEYYLY